MHTALSEPSRLQPGNNLVQSWGLACFGNTVLYLFQYPGLLHTNDFLEEEIIEATLLLTEVVISLRDALKCCS